MSSIDYSKGENDQLEFKVALSSDTKHYLKTIVAFANTKGGKIVVGIDDKTLQVVGVDPEYANGIMDAIANAVSNQIEPQLIPDLDTEYIEEKLIIIIDVKLGKKRPYCIKKEGMIDGVYVRVGATSRPATRNKIRELILAGDNQFWDEQPCPECPVDEASVKALCDVINQRRKAAGKDNRLVDQTQLLNLNVLRLDNGKLVANNAFALLTGQVFTSFMVQCGRFKGNDRDTFIDRKEFTGPIYELVEKAFNFVFSYIKVGGKQNGIYLEEVYEVPLLAVREMIVNAICHCNYLDDSPVQVLVFDNRIEVTSPGGLYDNLTLELALNGRTKKRNRAIYEVFHLMEIIEGWGSGLRRIIKLAKEYNLKDPEFIDMGDAFRVNLYRPEDTEEQERKLHQDAASSSTKTADAKKDPPNPSKAHNFKLLNFLPRFWRKIGWP